MHMSGKTMKDLTRFENQAYPVELLSTQEQFQPGKSRYRLLVLRWHSVSFRTGPCLPQRKFALQLPAKESPYPLFSNPRPHAKLNPCGGSSSAGRASVCGTECRGFNPRLPPQTSINFHLPFRPRAIVVFGHFVMFA